MSAVLAILGTAADTEAATRAYLDLLQGPARERSDRYFEGGYWILLWETVAFVAICWAVLRSGASARLRSWSERLAPRWLAPGAYALMLVPTLSLLLLPWGLYAGWYREHRYGLSNLTLGGWLSETALATGVAALALAIVFSILFALMRRFPRTWWLWGGGALSGFFAFSILVAPVAVAPLFNDYVPMAPTELRDDLLAMARAQGVPADNVYVVDESRQHSRVSAFVTGLGPTIRIGLNDNLLERTTPEEVRAVMGHELGHYVLGHMPLIWVVSSAIGLLILYLVFRLSPHLIARFGERWGLRQSADPAVLPLYLALTAALLLALTPLTSTFSRTIEARADEFGLDAAREPDGFARVALRLSEYRKLQPSPIEEFVFFDHPSGEARIRRAMEWKARHDR